METVSGYQSVERKPGQGHLRATMTREDCHLFIRARHYRNDQGCAVGPDFIVVDDNTRPHKAHLVNKLLGNEDIHQMDWPVRSPDLIPIDGMLWKGKLQLATSL
ncbi:DDE_3 domain-containing protein [Trichonephila clavipes]|nr:DDE_3 domain-containing protein [Trichonephila clavipes]